jgi:4-amino-4-deoxy-L-arabinose transferase-like glycosyltransferase
MRLADVATRKPARAAFLGALFSALVTLPGLGIGTLWDNSETAYGEVAREILITHDWLVMHLNGVPWFVQPPLYFWIAALCAKLFGVGTLSLRLPSALATIAMGGAVGYAVARIAGTRAGVVAAVVLSTNLMQAVVGRLAIMDALLDLTVAAAILWLFRAFEPARTEAGLDRGRRAAALVGGAAMIALGTLAKGPVCPVVTGLVIGVWLAWEARAGRPLPAPDGRAVLIAVAVFVAVALPWFAFLIVRIGPSAVTELIGHYTVGRYTGVIENQAGPWWYYVPVLILGFFPWTAFVPVGLARTWPVAQGRDGAFARLAIVWLIVPVVFFSFAQTKLPNYVALVFPALAIVVALWFERIVSGADRLAAILSAAAVPVTVGAIAIAIDIFGRDNKLALGVVHVQLLTIGIAMLAGSIATVVAIAWPRGREAAPYVLATTSLVVVLFIIFIGEPIADALKPIPPLAAIIDAQRKAGDAVAIADVSGGNALIFYTQPGVKTIDAHSEQSYVDVICPTGTVYLVTQRSDAPLLTREARALQRSTTQIGAHGRAVLLRIDGRDCPHD